MTGELTVKHDDVNRAEAREAETSSKFEFGHQATAASVRAYGEDKDELMSSKIDKSILRVIIQSTDYISDHLDVLIFKRGLQQKEVEGGTS